MKKYNKYLYALIFLGSIYAESTEIDFNDAVIMATKKGPKDIKCLRVTKNLRVCGESQFDGDVNITEDVAIGGDLTITGSLIVDGTVITPGGGGSGLLAYGQVASNQEQTLSTGNSVSFNIEGPALGTIPSSAGITVTNAGVYRMEFQVLAGGASPISFDLLSNGDSIPNAVFTNEGGGDYTISGSWIASLPANALLTLFFDTVGQSVTLPLIEAAGSGSPSINAVFTVERIA